MTSTSSHDPVPTPTTPLSSHPVTTTPSVASHCHTPVATPELSPHQAPPLTFIMDSTKLEGARSHTTVSAEVEPPKPSDDASQTLTNGTQTSSNEIIAVVGDAAEVKDSKAKDKTKNKKVKSGKKTANGKTKCKRKQSHTEIVKSGKKSSDSDDSSSSSSSSSDSSDSAESDSDSDSGSSSSSSEDEAAKKKAKKAKAKLKAKKEKEKLKKAKAKAKAKKAKKSKKAKVDSSSDSDSDADSESDDSNKRSLKKKRSRKSKTEKEESAAEDEAANETTTDAITTTVDGQNALQQIISALTQLSCATGTALTNEASEEDGETATNTKRSRSSRSRRIRGQLRAHFRSDSDANDKPADGKSAYKRVDQIWDTNIHDYRLQETAKEQADTFDDYVFHVRRRFDWENKFRDTTVDIKSKQLQVALQEIMKGVRAISLVESEPSIDPNMLFLYLEEMRTFYKKTLKQRIKREKKKKPKRRLQLQRDHLKLMIGYLDKDYDSTKKTLGPMMKAGNITFELLWALFKPNSIAFTTTYGAADQPRCFKVDQAYKTKSFTRGEYYVVEGRYLEYDGKNFGLGEVEMTIDSFKGPRKITQLSSFPLQYHKAKDDVRKLLVQRGKKFVTLAGMNFKHMNGLAFQKKKKQMLKFNVNGRVMIDPKTFRRENANYQVSTLVAPEDPEDSDDESCCGCGSDDDDDDAHAVGSDAGSDAEVDGGVKFKFIVDGDGKTHYVEVGSDEELEDELEDLKEEKIDKLGDGENPTDDLGKKREFSEEELLIASPVVLGFSFVEKSWFEFSVSGIGDITWDDGAFDSLVLDPNHKSIVKAQVCSHKYNSNKTIDDIIQGKGKGLVFVLHGPPGVGKTLTAEGIAEFLRCPLYAVSAGDLGTDARIEAELTKIMSIAHSWGAVLLLDEADVFLEKRQHQDVHRNALVSVFLRLLEYFQGILFLTTNRVETFDEAFQSRIHIALKYAELGVKAKREIWRMFLTRVAESGGEIGTFRDVDYDRLSRSNLNGRQIKNMVKTAQALAVYEKAPLNMEHIRRVLDVAESFERDFKGGTGYEDAMRSYT